MTATVWTCPTCHKSLTAFCRLSGVYHQCKASRASQSHRATSQSKLTAWTVSTGGEDR